MLHTAVVSIPEISVPSPGRNKPPQRIRGGSLLIACCRRSDSGVQREGREREKNKEEKRERGRNAFLRSHPSPTPSVVFFSSSHISLWCPTIWTPGTDYFADPRNTVLWINSELRAANSIPAFTFLRYSSILFGIAPSALITFGTTFTLYLHLPQLSFSFQKLKFSVFYVCFSFTVISSECDTRITLTAQAKGIGAAGNENYILLLLLFLWLIIIIIILYFSLMRSVFRRCVSGNLSLEVSALRQWLPIRAHKLFHRCVLCSNFRRPFSTSLFFFAFWLLPFLYCGSAI